MTTTRTIAALAVLALAVGSGSSLPATPELQAGITRTDLQRHDLGVPGREVIQTRVELAPGVSSGKHWHPGEEIVYVIDGSLEYQVDGRPPTTLQPGAVLFIPAQTIHSAKNIGRGRGVELATYVVEKGKPLVVMLR